jgi:FMN-dependent NADH-azoreductase
LFFASILLLLSFPLEKLCSRKVNRDTDKYFALKYKSQHTKNLLASRKLKEKYLPMYKNQALERQLIPGDPSSEEGNELGIALGDTMGGTMSLSLADTPKVVMVNQAPFYSYI